MFRPQSIVLLCTLLLSTVEARCEEGQPPEILEGTWIFVSSTGGTHQKQENSVRGGMAFKGDTVCFVDDRKKVVAEGTFTMDESKRPRTMDITLEKNGAKVLTRAIYEVEGDTLRICHYLGARASSARPREFVADERCVVGVLKREDDR